MSRTERTAYLWQNDVVWRNAPNYTIQRSQRAQYFRSYIHIRTSVNNHRESITFLWNIDTDYNMHLFCMKTSNWILAGVISHLRDGQIWRFDYIQCLLHMYFVIGIAQWNSIFFSEVDKWLALGKLHVRNKYDKNVLFWNQNETVVSTELLTQKHFWSITNNQRAIFPRLPSAVYLI